MEKFNKWSLLVAGCATLMFASCKNQDIEFPDYEGGTTVYFAYQYPLRTLVLGEDLNDNSLDNQHKCKIYATMGGVYENGKQIVIDVKVDNSLCDNLFFDDGKPVKALPASHYQLLDDKIVLNKSLRDGVEVQFTDAFFADADALANNYVIPLVMTNQSGADNMITGKPIVDGTTPERCNSGAWDVKPKDYVLYCVKYINQWDANYLRRGVDKITEGESVTTVSRRKQYVENDEECSLTTASLRSAVFPVSTQVRVDEGDGETVKTLTCNLILTFDESNNCTVTSGTAEYAASGTGKFVSKGEKNSWGAKDRDAIYLDYKIDFGTKQFATVDTLVARDRGIKLEVFSPYFQE